MLTKFPTAAQAWLTTMLHAVIAGNTSIAEPASPGDDDSERGDVPGWVMITVMTVIITLAYPIRA